MKRLTLISFAIVLTLAMVLSACSTNVPAATDTGAGNGYPAGPTTADQANAYPAASQAAPGVSASTAYPADSGSSLAGTTVRVATDATFPPFEMIDENTQKPTGFDVELMNAIAQKEGFNLEWINAGFDAIDAGIAQCQYDAVIAAMTITDARKQTRLFSDPYISAGQILAVRADETAITSKDDLSGKKVGAQIGTTGAMEAEKIADAELVTYDSLRPGLHRLDERSNFRRHRRLPHRVRFRGPELGQTQADR